MPSEMRQLPSVAGVALADIDGVLCFRAKDFAESFFPTSIHVAQTAIVVFLERHEVDIRWARGKQLDYTGRYFAEKPHWLQMQNFFQSPVARAEIESRHFSRIALGEGKRMERKMPQNMKIRDVMRVGDLAVREFKVPEFAISVRFTNDRGRLMVCAYDLSKVFQPSVQPSGLGSNKFKAATSASQYLMLTAGSRRTLFIRAVDLERYFGMLPIKSRRPDLLPVMTNRLNELAGSFGAVIPALPAPMASKSGDTPERSRVAELLRKVDGLSAQMELITKVVEFKDDQIAQRDRQILKLEELITACGGLVTNLVETNTALRRSIAAPIALAS